MALQIYDTLEKKLRPFEPLETGKVKMYLCGPTVYNYLHIGNFRGVVFFNMVRNWLEKSGYKVQFALNFTDVDDRIIKGAHEEGIEPIALSERYIGEYKKDFHALELRDHDFTPKVTDHIEDIRAMIDELVKKNMAYAVEGDVMYAVENFEGYGKLSGRNIEDLQAGARVEIDHKKKNPLDFALWKGAKPGEPSWPSPWGPGRPGWHIECSAMIKNIFGDQIDIHGGGLDLIFPHHENEIAQSEGCSNKTFVKYWMHTNMLNFGGQKMSKSLGNFVTMRDFLAKYNSEIYKWMILSVHYRSSSEFTDEGVHRAVSGLARIYSALAVAESFAAPGIAWDPTFEKITGEAWGKITEALNDDFGTPNAVAVLFEVIRQFNTQVKRGLKTNPALQAKSASFLNFVKSFGQLMSLFQHPANEFLLKLDDMLLAKMNVERKTVDALVTERSQARAQKDFAKSDELRAKLTALGISVSDVAEGSIWEVTK